MELNTYRLNSLEEPIELDKVITVLLNKYL